MAKPHDILLDETGDVYARKGDFVVEDSSLQNQKLLLISQKGEWKNNPEAGVGLANFILDDISVIELHQEIQKEFELDGMTVHEIRGKTFEDTEVEAEYE